jgi:hypothetical protein
VARRQIRKSGLRAASIVCLFIGIPYDALEQEASLATHGLASRSCIAGRHPRSNLSILARAQRELARLAPSGSKASSLLGGPAPGVRRKASWRLSSLLGRAGLVGPAGLLRERAAKAGRGTCGWPNLLAHVPPASFSFFSFFFFSLLISRLSRWATKLVY